jgi:hypothetical protein
MELWQQITNLYPELAVNDCAAFTNEIRLQDDADGVGAYIAKWEYVKPIPEGLTLGKPAA